MQPDVHYLRRFCSRTIDPLEKGTLAHLKSAYKRMKQELDNMDKELATSDLRQHRLTWEVFSPYEERLMDRYAVAIIFGKIAIGIMSYGYLEMFESIINFMPSLEQYNGREAQTISGLLGMLLPVPPDLKDDFYLRSHLDELQVWYDEHKDNLTWDDKTLRFYLDDLDEKKEDDRSSSE